jgi:hypothetical protein
VRSGGHDHRARGVIGEVVASGVAEHPPDVPARVVPPRLGARGFAAAAVVRWRRARRSAVSDL